MLSSGLNTVISAIKGSFGANSAESAVKSADSASGDSFASAFSEASAPPSSSAPPRSGKAVSTAAQAKSTGTSLPSAGESLPPSGADSETRGLGHHDLAPAGLLVKGLNAELGTLAADVEINSVGAVSLPTEASAMGGNPELSTWLASAAMAGHPSASTAVEANALSNPANRPGAWPPGLLSGQLGGHSTAQSASYGPAALPGLAESAASLNIAAPFASRAESLVAVDGLASNAGLSADPADLAPWRALGERLMSDLQRSPSQLAGQASGKMPHAVGLASHAAQNPLHSSAATAVMSATEQAVAAELNPAIDTLAAGLAAANGSPLARASSVANQSTVGNWRAGAAQPGTGASLATDALAGETLTGRGGAIDATLEGFAGADSLNGGDSLNSADSFERALSDAKTGLTLAGREAANAADNSGAPRTAEGFTTSLNTAAAAQRTSDVPTMANTLVDDLQHAPDSGEFPEEVMTKLRLLQDGGRHEARLNLHPAELGRLQISVTTEGDSTKVAFTVDNPQAREALEQAMPRLRELLAQSGLALSEGSVFEQGQQGQQDQALADAGAQGWGNGAAMAASGDAAEPSNGNTDDPSGAQASTALLDAYA